MVRRIALLWILWLGLISGAMGQDITVRGRVIDAKTAEGLAFVNIGVKGTQRGVISDIDGAFEIRLLSNSDVLKFSFVGYKPLEISVQEYPGNYPGKLIRMTVAGYQVKEVTVTAGINPAHRIINRAIDHKRKNNWEHLPFYTYRAYNRFVITQDKTLIDNRDSAYKDKVKKKSGSSGISISLGDERSPRKKRRDSIMRAEKAGDTALVRKLAADSFRLSTKAESESTDSFFAKQHLFLTETTSEKFYKAPDRVKTKIIAARVSGFKDPLFTLLSTQFAAFNIYSDFINISGKKYLSPVAYGSVKKYSFTLEDSIYKGNDTIYIISFRPRPGKLFDGMAGVINIISDSGRYAVLNVSAHPFIRDEDGSGTVIVQSFKELENGVWFPDQINTRTSFGKSNFAGTNELVGISKNYTEEINLKDKPHASDFRGESFEVDKNAMAKGDSFINRLGADSASQKDKTTYKVLDSVGKSLKFDRKLKFAKALASGRLPIGPIDLILDKFLNYNGYEGFRLGAGLGTNDRFSKIVELRGYYAYGFKDKANKFGGEAFLKPLDDIRLRGFYFNDVREFGAPELVPDKKLQGQESTRNFYLTQMFHYERYGASIDAEPFKYMKLRLQHQVSLEEIKNSYRYLSNDGSEQYKFRFEEASAAIRYAYKEKKISMPGFEIITGSKWPVLYATYTRGLPSGLFPASSNGYTTLPFERIDLRLDKSFTIRLAGTLGLSLFAGKVNGRVPLEKMYNGHGNRGKGLSLSGENTFETMPIYGYFASEYVAAYLTQNFGKYLFKKGRFSPVLSLHLRGMIGDMPQREQHVSYAYTVPSRGYYETGFSLDNILKLSSASYGLGVFYRMGPYSTGQFRDDFAIKLSIKSFIFSL